MGKNPIKIVGVLSVKRRKGLVFLIVLGLALSNLWGCREATGKNALRVGTEASFPPFETLDRDNNIVGFDIDIINYIAEDNGWEIVVVNKPFDTLLDSLAAGELDIVIAGLTITPQRQAQVLFSQPYYNASQVMVVRAEEERDFDLADIPDLGLRVAVQTGTTGLDEAAAILGAEDHPNLFQSSWAMDTFKQLKSCWVDVVIIDKPVAEYYIAELGDLKIHGQPFTNEEFGIAVQKGNTEMLDQINASLRKLRTSGQYNALFKKWFHE